MRLISLSIIHNFFIDYFLFLTPGKAGDTIVNKTYMAPDFMELTIK